MEVRQNTRHGECWVFSKLMGQRRQDMKLLTWPIVSSLLSIKWVVLAFRLQFHHLLENIRLQMDFQKFQETHLFKIEVITASSMLVVLMRYTSYFVFDLNIYPQSFWALNFVWFVQLYLKYLFSLIYKANKQTFKRNTSHHSLFGGACS